MDTYTLLDIIELFGYGYVQCMSTINPVPTRASHEDRARPAGVGRTGNGAGQSGAQKVLQGALLCVPSRQQLLPVADAVLSAGEVRSCVLIVC